MTEQHAAYALGRDTAETDRLRQQAVELREQSLALLDRTDLGLGGSAVDLGCGPLGILDLLEERVGPAGRVVGVDAHPGFVAHARRLAGEHVEVLEADARRTGLPSASFDLVHARTLLINIPDPGEAVAEMARLARPGGWVAVQEPDMTVVTHPAGPAHWRLLELLVASHAKLGADPFVGRRLPDLLRGAGLVDVGVEVWASVYPPGHTRRTLVPDLARSIRPRVVELGLASEAELADLDRRAREFLDDPDTLVVPHLFFLAWGRGPA
jgi:trans-aconitate methyltransferase